MAIKHNQQIPHNHFRKDWQRRVRTHFDQPGKKVTRRLNRRAKAVALAPRPVDKLRPIVRAPTLKYNRKLRAGRGFTLAELKAAGVPRNYAPTVGIAVDYRRQNLSEESLALNVERLKEYVSRLIVFPRKSSKPKKGDSGKSTELSTENSIKLIGTGFPIVQPAGVTEIKKGDVPAAIKGGAYRKLRDERSVARYQGVRDKREKDKAEAEANKK